MLSHLTHHCFKASQHRQNKYNCFNLRNICTLNKFHDKFDELVPIASTILELLSGIPGVKGFDYCDPDASHSSITELFVSSAIMEDIDIFLIDNLYYHDGMFIPMSLLNGDGIFELRYLGCSWRQDNCELCGEAYMHHGNFNGQQHSKWWYQKRNNLPVQVNDIVKLQLTTAGYVMCYVKVTRHNLDSLGREYISYIGGQSTYECPTHNLPLIASTCHKMMCTNKNCSRRERFCCPSMYCPVHVCLKCVQDAPEGEISYADSVDGTELIMPIMITHRHIRTRMATMRCNHIMFIIVATNWMNQLEIVQMRKKKLN